MSSPKRVAIITGAAAGIGRAIASRLAQDGFDLGLFDLPSSQQRLEELAEGLKTAHGARVVLVYGDVVKEADVEGLVETVVKELGSLYAVCILLMYWEISVVCCIHNPVQMIANPGVAVNRVLHESMFPLGRQNRLPHCFAIHAYSTNIGARSNARHQRQRHLFLVQVRCHPATQAGHRRSYDRRRIRRQQARSVALLPRSSFARLLTFIPTCL